MTVVFSSVRLLMVKKLQTLEERLQGRYTKKSVKNPTTGEVIVGPDTLITEDMAAAIVNAGVEEVTIRSVFNVIHVTVSAVTVTVSTCNR
ncbi:MAG: hypothetical protein ACLTZB_07305 [Streptococcus salivarius]